MDEQDRAPWAEDVATHRVIKGRRWRTSDPRIPEPLRQALVDELMAARRAVGTSQEDASERAARDRVQDAKVALGERGLRWWTADPDPEEVKDRVVRAERALGRRQEEGDPRLDDIAAVVSCSTDLVAELLERARAVHRARDAPVE